jgi:hypothetical protein
VGVIVLVDALHGQNGGSGPSGASVVAPVSTSVARASSTPPATTSSPPAPTSSPPVHKTAPPKAVPTPPPAATTVQVFNVTRHSGLAQNAANRLRAAGYRVTRVSDKTGVTLAATTVYYDPGNATEHAEADGIVARGIAAAAAVRPASVPATGTLILYVT